MQSQPGYNGFFAEFGSGTLTISLTTPQDGRQLGSACPCATDSAGGVTPGGDEQIPHPVSIASGNEYEHVTDYSTTGANPLKFERYYNSRASQSTYATSLGHNWRTIFDRYLQITTDTSNAVKTVIAERPDGKILTFSLLNGVWKTDGDVDVSLTQQSGMVWTLTDGDDTTETYTVTANNYSPNSINEALVTKTRARNGYTQTLTYNNGNGINATANFLTIVSDSYGRTLTLTPYTDTANSGLLKSIKTPDSSSPFDTYTYTASGASGSFSDRLSKVQYADQSANIYYYGNKFLPYALTGITDESGTNVLAIGYDGSGRATSVQEAGGVNKVSIAYDDNSGTRTLTKALGEQLVYKTANQWTYNNVTYQGAPKIVSIARGTGTNVPTETMTYNANGYMASRTDWNGHLTTYTNNTHGAPTKIVQKVSPTEEITTDIVYDSTWPHLPSEIDEQSTPGTPGLKTTFTYYGESACPLNSNGSSNGSLCTKTQTDLTGTPTTSNGGNTRTWTYTWTSTGQMLSVKGPRTDVALSSQLTYQSGAPAVLQALTNTLGQTVLTVNQAYGGGLPTTVTDANGLVTNLTYDLRLRPATRSIVATDGTFTTTFTPDGRGSLVKSTTLPDLSVVGTNYDAAYRLKSVVNGLGQASVFSYDLLGDKLRTQYQATLTDNTVIYKHTAVYNSSGWLTDDIGGMNGTNGVHQDTAVVQYDNNGNPLIIQDPLGRPTTRTYDWLDRVATVTEPPNGSTPGAVTQFFYDAHGRTTKVIDANGNATTYTYDGFGDLITRVSPDSGTTVYTYDLAGNLKSSQDAAGVTAAYTYDNLNRVKTVVYAGNPAENETYTYDSYSPSGTNLCNYGIGHLCFLQDASGTLSRSYDQRGNMLTETRVHGPATLSTAYAYDAMNRVAELQYPSGWTVKYTRDASGAVASIGVFQGAVNALARQQRRQMLLRGKSPLAAKPMTLPTIQMVALNIARQPFGPVSSLTFKNGLVETRSYDLDYRLSSIVASNAAGANAQSLTYGYNDSNTVATIVDGIKSGNNQTFTYDSVDHLISALGEYGQLGWTYDLVGNRTSGSNGGVTNITYGYKPGTNQMNGITTAGYTEPLDYTASGNLYLLNGGYAPSSPGRIGYNQTRRLRNVVDGYGVSYAQYFYDAFGKRIVVLPQGIAAQSQLYQYDQSGNLLETTDVNGIAYTDRIYLDDGRPVAELIPGTSQIYAIHTDRLGTPQLMTGPDRSTLWQVNYHPFGEIDTVNTSQGQPLRFPGQYQDSYTGWYMNGRRDYVPSWGRYLQTDPVGLNGGLNTYAYAGSNPVNRVDPKGTCGPFTPFCIAAAEALLAEGATAGAAVGTEVAIAAVAEASGGGLLAGTAGATTVAAATAAGAGAAAVVAVETAAVTTETAAVGGAAICTAEGSGAVVPMAEAALATGTIRTVAGYEIGGNAGLVGSTYNMNIWGLYATKDAQGLAALASAFKAEAAAAGATGISISGLAIINPGIANLSAAFAARFGFIVSQINSTTIMLQGPVP